MADYFHNSTKSLTLHRMTTQEPLLIYSASAGSGKTYTLVKTYLELILKGDVNPNNFSKIIAMTFTNKAALEMKTRIVDALADLSQPLRHTNASKREKAIQYGKNIAQEFRTTPEELQRKARIALVHILHQYEDFFIMTIDKFNLRLIRSFATDLDIDSNFKVSLDDDDLKQRVIDNFLSEIDNNISNLLAKIFLQLADLRVSDGESWNFEKTLSDYLKISDKEETIELLNQVENVSNTQEFIQSLLTQVRILEEELNVNAASFIAKMRSLLEGEKGRSISSINNLLNKLETNNVSDLKSDTFKTTLKYLAEGTLPDILHQALEDFYSNHFELLAEFEKASKIKDSFLYIQVLRKVNERLKDFRKTEQIIRISEFNQMISDLLKNEEAPYIYEKLGTRYNHFLLDEFQDTSRLQWQNIIPLVHESISHRHKNLIVGDPKQSIYRFRGGVADQFVALPAIYNPTNDPHLATLSRYFEKMGVKDELKDNYRSTKDIVEFNNFFFSEFVQFIKNAAENANDYTAYYDRIKQNPKNNEQGFVEIISMKIDKKSKKDEDTSSLDDDDNQDASTENIQYLIKCVNDCLEDGYAKGDICILGDESRTCNSYALALTQNGHKVVSVDSLSVNSDASVKLCLIYLNWRNQPSNELLAKRFVEYYFSIKQPQTATELYQSYFKQKPHSNDDQKLVTYFDYKQFISDYFGEWNEFHFAFENLYTLLERFYKMVGFNELENPYLHHLSDLAFNHDLNNGPDLNSFIDYYNKKGNTSSIQTPENSEAIKIMTSHKSKGLEFKVVIIPQLNKEFLKHNNAHLLKLDNQLAYTQLSDKYFNSELLAKYQEEYRASLLDKLNLCYVAFTRPIERLYVMNTFKQTRKTFFGAAFIHPFLQTEAFKNFTIPSNNDNQIIVQFGKRLKLNANQDKENVNHSQKAFEPINVSDKLWFPEISLKHQLDGQENDGDINEQRRYGMQLHLLLSELDHYESIPEILTAFEKKGLIETIFITDFQKDLARITSNETYQSLHKNYTQIINEQAIIISDKEVKRPDKIILKSNETIVIDYKTGLKSNSHQKQVATYCAILRNMNFPNVQGFVCYTQDLQFVSCN